jgi:hypothetical protein
MEIEIDEIFGLPAHPLLVHIPVVLIPTALVVLVIALWPAARRPALLGAAAMAAIGAIGTVLAVGAGDKLQDRVRETEQVEEHTEQGEQAELPAIAFGILAVATAAVAETARRRSERVESTDPATPSGAAAGRAHPVGPSDGPGGTDPTTSGAVATEVRVPADVASTDEDVKGRNRLPAVLLALSLLVGAYATYTVVDAGHSGAEATWHDTPATRSDDD